MLKDVIHFKGSILVEKFLNDPETGLPMDKPYEVIECDNLGLTTGLTEMWKLVTGQAGTAFSNANATIGVGDSATAPSAGQTDLQAATNKTYKAMETSYPSTPASAAVQFKATFGSTDANYAWNEFVIKNSSSSICLNRSTNSGSGWGTKAAGTTWVATATLTLA